MRKTLAELASVREASGSKGSDALTTSLTEEIKIDVDKIKQHKLFIATPCYGGNLTDQYFLSMFDATQELQKLGIHYKITTLRNESLITRGRNILTAMFLESDCTHLLFIDADIEFPKDAIIRALAHDKPIVAGAYPKKGLDLAKIAKGESGISYAINFKYENFKEKKLRIENGLVEVLDASTGFFMIQRSVLDQMRISYPELSYNTDSNLHAKYDEYMYAFFDTGIDPSDRRYLSEDYYFSRLWQKLGGEIWIDIKTKLNHVGSYTFQGDVESIIGDNRG